MSTREKHPLERHEATELSWSLEVDDDEWVVAGRREDGKRCQAIYFHCSGRAQASWLVDQLNTLKRISDLLDAWGQGDRGLSEKGPYRRRARQLRRVLEGEER